MDGVKTDYILTINGNIIKPDLQVAVYADENILHERLNKRNIITRFEKNNQSNVELYYMSKGIKTLQAEGVEVLQICNNTNIEKM